MSDTVEKKPKMTETTMRPRLWDMIDARTSKLLEEEPVPSYTPITVDGLTGKDALLERLRKVHGEDK
jgi:hypothetical protein